MQHQLKFLSFIVAVSCLLTGSALAAPPHISAQGKVQIFSDPNYDAPDVYLHYDQYAQPLYLGSVESLNMDTQECLFDAEKAGKTVSISADLYIQENGQIIVDTPSVQCQLTSASAQPAAPSAQSQNNSDDDLFAALDTQSKPGPHVVLQGTAGYTSEAGMTFYTLTTPDGHEINIGAPFEYSDANQNCLSISADNNVRVQLEADTVIYSDNSQGIKAETAKCTLLR